MTTSIGTSEEDVERLVAAMDVDGDGKVTYQEYLASFRLLTMVIMPLINGENNAEMGDGDQPGIPRRLRKKFLDDT